MEKNQERCTCGDTRVVFYPDENQHEPNCWDCWHQAKYGAQYRMIVCISAEDNSAEDELPF